METGHKRRLQLQHYTTDELKSSCSLTLQLDGSYLIYGAMIRDSCLYIYIVTSIIKDATLVSFQMLSTNIITS
jgi:hypothetical protein